MQAFENYPKLAQHLQRMASTGHTGSMGEWNNFLQEINTVIEELEAEIMASQNKSPEVIWGEPLRTQFEIEETLRNEIDKQQQREERGY